VEDFLMATLMRGDLPTIATASTASNTYSLGNLGVAQGAAQGHGGGGRYPSLPAILTAGLGGGAGGAYGGGDAAGAGGASGAYYDYKPKESRMPGRRYVRVLVVDPNENIPLDQCVLYAGEEKLTDLNDQELFFELDIKSLLAAHNECRAEIIDKKVKERTEFLEPAKIRDLKMVVVTVAEF
jgi:hypothetical protein